jgi:hypothetical protein
MLDLPVGGIAQKKRRVIDSRVSPPALFIIYMVFLQYLDVDISTVEINVIAASFFFQSNEVALLMPALLFFCFGLKSPSMITYVSDGRQEALFYLIAWTGAKDKIIVRIL